MRIFFKIIKITLLIFLIFLNFNSLSIKIAESSNGYLQKVIHEGDLIIQGDEEYIIDGKEFIQIGKIVVKERGKLIIRNSNLEMKQLYANQYNIFIRDNAFFHVENSKINSDFTFILQFGYWGGLGEPPPIGTENPKGYFKKLEIKVYAAIRVQKGGELEVWDSNLSHIRGGYTGSTVTVSNSYIGDFRFFEKSKIRINNSTIGLLMPYFIGNTIAEIHNLKPGFYESWSLGSVQNAHYDFTMINTKVDGWEPYVGDKAHITIIDSKLTYLGLRFYFGSSELSNLMNRETYEYWNLKESQNVQSDLNIILKNTSVENWYFTAYKNSIVKLDSSNIQRFAALEYSTIHILSSEIGQSNYSDYSSGKILNSKITDFIFFGPSHTSEFSGSVEINQTTIQNKFKAEFANLNLTGDIKFQNTQIDRWYKSNVNRQFKVYTLSSKCVRAPGIDLIVFDPGGKEIWNGYSDANGESFFNVIFTDENYNKDFTLRSYSLGSEIKFNVISSTPLIIPPNNPPKLQTIGNKTAYTGKEIKFKVNATDVDNCPLTYRASPLPLGAFINSLTGEFSWTPSYSQVGVHKIRFSVSDGIDDVYEDIKITVNKGKKGKGRI